MNQKIFLFIALLLPFFMNAQSYDTAMGLRLGTDWGLSLKQRVAKKTTVEAIFQSSFAREESMISILGAQHMPFITRRFNMYTGGGIHKGWSNRVESDYKGPFGLSLIAGLELSLGSLNLSYDIKPAINFTGGDQVLYVQTGLTIRYVLLERNFLIDDKEAKRRKRKRRRKKKNDDWKFWKD